MEQIAPVRERCAVIGPRFTSPFTGTNRARRRPDRFPGDERLRLKRSCSISHLTSSRSAHRARALIRFRNRVGIGVREESGVAQAETDGATMYDTMIVGGEVVDPGAGLQGALDVAIGDGRIVDVAPNLDRSAAREVIDASGADRDPRAGRPAHPRLLGRDLLGHRGRSGRGAHRGDDLARRRLVGFVLLARVSPLHRRAEPDAHLRAVESLLDRPDRADLGVRQPRLLRPRSGGDDRRCQPGPDPRHQGAHRQEHHPRRRYPRAGAGRGSWPTGSVCR